ncbi:MAG: aldolase/citrate lyase family protein [Acidimicrobiia bacterium]|nr:aldolase/citrate lyase family protein [Acidimicrobiia bacterium]
MTTPIRTRWRDGEATLGGWLSIPSPVSAEITARAGFDYVCVDTQHGAIEYSDAVPIIQAILLGGSSPIARVPWNEPGIIGKMLDAGAHGVIVPMVNSVAEAEAVVQSCRYAPVGSRSFGPGLAAPRLDSSYVEWAQENIAVIPMIETVQAVEALDDILAVDGIDAVYVGPADLSLTLGLPPGNNDDATSFTDALEAVVSACAKAGVVAGIHSTGSLTQRRLAAGFRMVTVTSDGVALRRGLADEAERARHAPDAPSGDALY